MLAKQLAFKMRQPGVSILPRSWCRSKPGERAEPTRGNRSEPLQNRAEAKDEVQKEKGQEEGREPNGKKRERESELFMKGNLGPFSPRRRLDVLVS